jgi:23S rRNA (cytidine1920-2'-O)/16S rRNA (cytidine1409-2'-O)-methyltransferase
MSARRRLDAELVRRGVVASRTDAQHAIELGRVLVNGAHADKASRLVAAGDAVVLQGDPPRFVSRGGDKLSAALDEFAIDVGGLRVLDAGASTGGFTDCLLQRGAATVYAIDVGHGQLHPKIRQHPRVVVRERCNVRSLTPGEIDGVVPLCVADLSFISLKVVAEAMLGCVEPGGRIVWLVKPQFEAGHVDVSRGRGVITDPVVHERVRSEIAACLGELGAVDLAWTTSPLTGASGNVEFLVTARKPSGSDRYGAPS